MAASPSANGTMAGDLATQLQPRRCDEVHSQTRAGCPGYRRTEGHSPATTRSDAYVHRHATQRCCRRNAWHLRGTMTTSCGPISTEVADEPTVYLFGTREREQPGAPESEVIRFLSNDPTV